MKPIKLLFGIVAAATIFLSSNVSANTPLDIKLNGSYIKTGYQGFIDKGNTLVPIRGISEVFGSDLIEWNEKERKVTVEYDGKSLETYIDTNNAQINNKWVNMPCDAVISDDKAYVGLRFICDFFGADVNWNKMTHTAEINKDGLTVEKRYIEDSYTSSDLEWLAKIVHAEAGGEPDNGKIAVANVVINRIESKDFPDTIYDVVFDRKYGVQFTPVANGAIYNNPSIQSYHSAKKAMFGENVVGNSLYFCNLKTSTNSWIPNNRIFYKKIGKHSFYL